jgi:hypothetical protein
VVEIALFLILRGRRIILDLCGAVCRVTELLHVERLDDILYHRHVDTPIVVDRPHESWWR